VGAPVHLNMLKSASDASYKMPEHEVLVVLNKSLWASLSLADFSSSGS